MPEAVAAEVAEYWPMSLELMAIIAEILDQLLLTTVRAYGGKPGREPLSIPRPGRVIERQKAKSHEDMVGMGAFANYLYRR